MAFVVPSYNMLGICVALGVLALLAYIYRSAYPRPYPGIPYNFAASKRFWGDVPDFLKAVNSTHDPSRFMFRQCRNLKSPVVQLFLRPFKNPVIVVSDAREVKDIISTRTKEFDRAPRTRESFRPIVDHSSLVKATTPEWKAQRRFWDGVMGTSFLNRVAAPKIHQVALEVVDLFKIKAAIADGRPFEFFRDIDLASFDVIWTVIFGTNLNGIKGQIENLRPQAVKGITQPKSKDCLATMPLIPQPDMSECIAHVIKTIEKTFASYSQTLHHWILRQGSVYRGKWALKEKIVNEIMESTKDRLSRLSHDELVKEEDTSAVVMGLRRKFLAHHGEHDIVPQSETEIRGELQMLLIGGYETVATVISWAVRFLTRYPDKQEILRKALLETYPQRLEGVQPSAEDILSKPTHYMEAWIEETLRMGNVSSRLARVATVDTKVLGYPIPKGAQVIFNPYIGEAPLNTPEELRSETSRQTKDGFQYSWDPEQMEEFNPERWLGDDGKFNPRMFPRLAFAAGPRGCYGRNLALQELRIMLALLTLNFKFEALPEEFSSLEPYQRILRVPRHCIVRLVPI